MNDPVVDFYRSKESDAETACRVLAEQVDAGESELLSALETAQDTLAHWRKLRRAFEAEAEAA